MLSCPKKIRHLHKIKDIKSTNYPPTEKDITLSEKSTEIKILNKEYISQGVNSKTYLISFILPKYSSQRKLTMVQRVISDEQIQGLIRKLLNKPSQQQQVEYFYNQLRDWHIWQLARKGKVPTYTTFRVDIQEKEIHQSALLDDKTIYVSVNNAIPKQYPQKLPEHLRFENLNSFIANLAIFAGKSAHANLQLWRDSVFYGLDKNPDRNFIQKNTSLMLGDYGEVKIVKNTDQEKAARNSFLELLMGLQSFIDDYIIKDLRKDYRERIANFQKEKTNGYFYTSSGTMVYWEEYDKERHGFILQHATINLDKDTTEKKLEQANKISHLVRVDATHLPKKLKHSLTKWQGTLIDNAENISYPQLEKANSIYCPQARTINLPNLHSLQRGYFNVNAMDAANIPSHIKEKFAEFTIYMPTIELS